MKNDSTKRPRPSQFNLQQLALLRWMLSAPEGSRRFVVTSGKSLKFFETGERRADGKFTVSGIVAEGYGEDVLALQRDFGGRIRVDPSYLVSAGLASVFHRRYPNMSAEQTSFEDKVADIFIPGKWNIDAYYYEIGEDWVRDWYAELGEPRRQKLLSAKVEKEATMRRRAVFGRPWRIDPAVPESISRMLPPNYGIVLPSVTVVRPCVVATIVDETEKRFKVRDIESINGNVKNWLGLTLGRDEYFEREYLILDNATDADIAALSSFDREYVAEVQRISDDTLSEVAPIIARMAERLKQKDGEHRDTLADLVTRLRGQKEG